VAASIRHPTTAQVGRDAAPLLHSDISFVVRIAGTIAWLRQPACLAAITWLTGCSLLLPFAGGDSAAPDRGRADRDSSGPAGEAGTADSGSCTPCVVTLAGTAGGFADGPALAAAFREPHAVAVGAGAVIVADTGNHRIRAIAGGQVTTLAGTGVAGHLDGPAAAAQLSSPEGVAVRGTAVIVADTGNHRLRVVQDGAVSTFAGSGVEGQTNGSIYAAQFILPSAIAVDGWGTVYVADRGSGSVRSISAGQVGTVASGLGTPSGLAVDSAGALYVADSKAHVVWRVQGQTKTKVAGSARGFADGPAAEAAFDEPSGALVLAGGAVLVADRKNHRLRRLADELVATLAGDGTGGDEDGPLAAARFREPVALAIDIAGRRVIVADLGNHRIRAVRGLP